MVPQPLRYEQACALGQKPGTQHRAPLTRNPQSVLCLGSDDACTSSASAPSSTPQPLLRRQHPTEASAPLLPAPGRMQPAFDAPSNGCERRSWVASPAAARTAGPTLRTIHHRASDVHRRSGVTCSRKSGRAVSGDHTASANSISRGGPGAAALSPINPACAQRPRIGEKNAEPARLVRSGTGGGHRHVRFLSVGAKRAKNTHLYRHGDVGRWAVQPRGRVRNVVQIVCHLDRRRANVLVDIVHAGPCARHANDTRPAVSVCGTRSPSYKPQPPTGALPLLHRIRERQLWHGS